MKMPEHFGDISSASQEWSVKITVIFPNSSVGNILPMMIFKTICWWAAEGTEKISNICTHFSVRPLRPTRFFCWDHFPVLYPTIHQG